MPELFIKRLQHGARLNAADRARIRDLCQTSYWVEAGEDVVTEGRQVPQGYAVLEGLAAPYKLLADGSRQIFQFLLPGDTCDIHRQPLSWRDNSLAALVRSRIVRISPEELDAITQEHPNLARAFWWTMVCAQGMMRERVTSLGRRSADKRLAHLFCELEVRMRSIDGVEANGDGYASFSFPVTQPELADAVGLTAVHVNRTLQQLRDADLVAFRGRRVTIMDGPRLAALAGFDPRYLHLDQVNNRSIMRST